MMLGVILLVVLLPAVVELLVVCYCWSCWCYLCNVGIIGGAGGAGVGGVGCNLYFFDIDSVGVVAGVGIISLCFGCIFSFMFFDPGVVGVCGLSW